MPSRPHGPARHFDGRRTTSRSGKAELPACSAVLLVEASDRAGRTVVTDRDPSDDARGAVGLVPEGNEANSLVAFRGELLHGVLPGRPGDERRTSLMFSFWETALPRTKRGARPTACMRLPEAPEDAWAKALVFDPPPPPAAWAPPPRDAPLVKLDPLFEPVAGAAADGDDAPPSAYFTGATTWRPLRRPPAPPLGGEMEAAPRAQAG